MKLMKEFIRISYDNSILGVVVVDDQQLLVEGSKTIYNNEHVWDIHFPNTNYWSKYIPVSIHISDYEITQYLMEQIKLLPLQQGELAGFEYD